MKKDKKWFVDKWTKERNKTDVHDPMYHFINEFIGDVNQLDEPEKPVIPQFVAEHIKKWKKSNVSLSYALSTLRDELTLFRGSDEEVKFWLYDPVDGFNNQELYARAWLAYPNIEIEKEPRWVVKYREVDGGRYYVASNGNAFSFYEEDGVLHSNPRSLRSQSAYKFTEISKAEAVALLIGGEVEVAE